MRNFQIGQRWISEMEPELGLGTAIQATDGKVHVIFPATGETRVYAKESAPLRRVTFRVGEEIEDHEGNQRVIESIRDEISVLTYFQSTGY